MFKWLFYPFKVITLPLLYNIVFSENVADKIGNGFGYLSEKFFKNMEKCMGISSEDDGDDEDGFLENGFLENDFLENDFLEDDVG